MEGKEPPSLWKHAYQRLGYEHKNNMRNRPSATPGRPAVALSEGGLPSQITIDLPQVSPPDPPAALRIHPSLPDSSKVSANEPSGDVAGHPTITRNTSSTNRAMATSLKSVAWGRPGQSWFAAQNRNATASMAALTNSFSGGRCATW